MPLMYKVDILALLKDNGYTTSRLRSEKIIGESGIQKIRSNVMVGINIIENICKVLNCQPGDLIMYEEDK